MREPKEETEKEGKKSGNAIEKNRIDCFDSAFRKLNGWHDWREDGIASDLRNYNAISRGASFSIRTVSRLKAIVPQKTTVKVIVTSIEPL